jgi:phospholipase C
MSQNASDFTSVPITRRRLLGSTAGMAAAAASALMPPNVRRALAEGPATNGSLRDIKHVVMLMQENRSFDHYFGTMSGVRGFGDENALKLPNGKSVFYQPDPVNPNGYLLPFHLDTRTSSAQKIPSTSHAWDVQHASWNGGKMDNWLPAHRKVEGEKAPYVMGYHTRDDIPFQFALAEVLTICDAYYCSLMGPIWPNRLYWMTGTIDADGEAGGPVTSNRKVAGGFRWTTYAERLEKAGISWKVYQQQDNYDCNVLEYFKVFQDADRDSNLHNRGMIRDPEGKFEFDVINDNLPMVSWIMPTSFLSEHPDYIPADGAAFVASKINATQPTQ